MREREAAPLLHLLAPPPDCLTWPLGFLCPDFKVPVGSIHLPGPPGISIDLQGKWRARLGYYAPTRLPWAVIECTQRIFETWPP